MAGDWIKMRTDLYRDPKTSLIADLLSDPDGPLCGYVNQNMQCDMVVTRNVTRNAAVGGLLSVWGVARHRGHRDGDDLVIDPCTLDAIDEIADLPGFGEAMKCVGWLDVSEYGVVFPDFFEKHNSEPCESHREKNKARQKRYRDKKRNVKKDVTRNVTVTLPPSSLLYSSLLSAVSEPKIPDVLATDDFAGAWDSWVAHREEIKKPLKKTMVISQLKKLAAMGEAKAVAMIDHTVSMGWVGLREPGDNGSPSKSDRVDPDEFEKKLKAAVRAKRAARGLDD